MTPPLPLGELSVHLRELAARVREAAARLSEDDWRASRGAGKWSRLEIAGHLIDSAANNHERIVRALRADSYSGPGYEQERHERAQGYAEAGVAGVVEFLAANNLHLSRVIERIPVHKEATPCTIGDYAPMALRDLVLDYVAHLEHHLRQIFAGHVELTYSGLPWPPAEGGRWT